MGNSTRSPNLRAAQPRRRFERVHGGPLTACTARRTRTEPPAGRNVKKPLDCPLSTQQLDWTVGDCDDSRSSDAPSAHPDRTDPIYRPEVRSRCDGCGCCCDSGSCNRCRMVSFRTAFEWLGNHHDAEDAVQELCFRLWKHFQTHDCFHYRGCPWCCESYARCCLCRRAILRNVVIDIIEKRSRAGVTNTDLIKRCHSAEPEPLTNVGDDEMRTILQDVISQLPPVREQVVRLRYYEKMTLETIAKTLKIGVSTAHTHLCRAYCAMKAMLCDTYGLAWETLQIGKCVHCGHSNCPCSTHHCRCYGCGCPPTEDDCRCTTCPICSY